MIGPLPLHIDRMRPERIHERYLKPFLHFVKNFGNIEEADKFNQVVRAFMEHHLVEL